MESRPPSVRSATPRRKCITGRDSRKTSLEENDLHSMTWIHLFETPMVTWLSLKDEERGEMRPWWKHLSASVLIAIAGIAFVGACSG